MMLSNNLQNVIHNPVIPYVGTLSEELGPGKLVVIHGHMPSDADRFQVDFQCGSSVKPRADVAFHFNPRFKRSGHIVCNTLMKEKWGWEEITYEMPFEKGKPFEIMIMVLKDKFQVAVNGKHLLLYKHRIEPEKIDTLGIYGKVQIVSIGFRSNLSLQGTQATSSGMLKTTSGNQMQTSEVSQFTLPYIARLNSALSCGRTIVIRGEVKKNPKGNFSIDLIASSTKDIALHLNPRLSAKAFVRNSFLCESWGEEERSITHFPFSPGMYFEMIIYCSANEYKVAINGAHVLEYKYRFKELDKIDTLKISGDIDLLDIRSW
ncbi:galectin-8-like isoform X3 [Vombatus ursinus]|uniref:Galectin n=2 Tax=Vombatus ursinus TaxID=29139 RepID=A0A4X2KCA8_VOMUR|nr:galectin-8-like isoform X2 [Vombatus ursinus]XP_027727588.1 galectin-8-like isoform X3 [Vombatus ursinus]